MKKKIVEKGTVGVTDNCVIRRKKIALKKLRRKKIAVNKIATQKNCVKKIALKKIATQNFFPCPQKLRY